MYIGLTRTHPAPPSPFYAQACNEPRAAGSPRVSPRKR